MSLKNNLIRAMDKHAESDMTPLSLVLWNQICDEPMEQANDINESPPPFESTSTEVCTNLQHMIEDCLREIFSVPTLRLNDLCSIAETCKRFRQIIQYIFPKRIQIETCNAKIFGVEYNHFVDYVNRGDIQRVFKNFGSNLSEVKITGTKKKNKKALLHLVTEHCHADNLKSLTIQWINITKVLALKLEPTLKQLQILCLNDVRLKSDATLFSKLYSLIDLRLRNVGNCSAVLENIFIGLERFEYTKRRITEEKLKTLSVFLSRHKNLRKLRFDCRQAVSTKSRFVKVIIDNCCKEIKELTINLGRTTGATLLPLKKLKSLQTLALMSVSFRNFKSFSAFTELRELSLCHCRLPNNSDEFACLKQLKVLNLHYFASSSIDVAGIISVLTNLKEMSIFEDEFVLNEKTFTRIVNIVKDRPNVLQLTCRTDFTLPKYDEKQRFRLYELADLLSEADSGDESEVDSE